MRPRKAVTHRIHRPGGPGRQRRGVPPRPGRCAQVAHGAVPGASAEAEGRSRLLAVAYAGGLFRIRQTQARGGSGRRDPKWPATRERISKQGSTALTISLALRRGGPGPARRSSALPMMLSHRPSSSRWAATFSAKALRSRSEGLRGFFHGLPYGNFRSINARHVKKVQCPCWLMFDTTRPASRGFMLATTSEDFLQTSQLLWQGFLPQP